MAAARDGGATARGRRRGTRRHSRRPLGAVGARPDLVVKVDESGRRASAEWRRGVAKKAASRTGRRRPPRSSAKMPRHASKTGAPSRRAAVAAIVAATDGAKVASGRPSSSVSDAFASDALASAAAARPCRRPPRRAPRSRRGGGRRGLEGRRPADARRACSTTLRSRRRRRPSGSAAARRRRGAPGRRRCCPPAAIAATRRAPPRDCGPRPRPRVVR